MDIRINDKTVIVFDLDDTLYPELDFLKSAYLSIAQRLEATNWKALYFNMLSQYRDKKNVFAFLEANYSVSKEELISEYRKHFPDIHPRPGALALISGIRELGGKIALITDGRSVTQRNKLKALGLEGLIDTLVISEEIGTEKPAIPNFKEVMDAYPGCHYWYVADNPKKDFIAPNQLQWGSICLVDDGRHIHSGFHLIHDAPQLPEYYILDLREIRILP